MFRSTKTVFLSLILYCLLAVCHRPAISQVTGEKQLKSVFIFNFVRLIDWPSGVEDSDIFNLCSLKKSDINVDLARLQDRVVRGKKLNIKLVSGLDNLQSCALVFLENGRFDLSSLSKSDISDDLLLVSDMPGFATCIGHIEFVVNAKRKNKLTLRVNKNNTDRDGFKVSSRILIRSTVLDSEECPE